MSNTCLKFEDLTLGYGQRAAVHHLSAAIAEGSLTAVVGSNGSGKSTLMKAVSGILKPMSGQCEVKARRLAYLPQQAEIDRTFPARVIDLVLLGLWQKRGLFGRHTRQDKADIENCLAAVGLTGFETRALDSLSGGQMQRALFARTMLQNADLILLDEPFNAVDEKTVGDLMRLIASWAQEGRTVLCVLHDHALVRQHFPQTLLLARKLVAFGATQFVLTEENLRRARAFQEAWVENAGWCGDAPAASEEAAHPHTHAHDHEAGRAAHV